MKSQTDDTPLYTSTGQHVDTGGVAISRDLLCGACRKLHHRCAHPEYGKKLHYGDWIYIDGFGFRQIDDVMGIYSTVRKNGKRIHIPILRHVDIFVKTWREEHAVNVKHRDVFKIKESYGTKK